ncbi:Holliday junction resolvase YEN1 [Candida viswanathii]|uniref:Holliday junction resolvase YEN1 n=1 Tax=Candida viswanathii TaxID=5486 RepID=A0A367Y9T2_9ASCO|nr:Holliday junction resolvase YEN1 [Candida viswanathii]
MGIPELWELLKPAVSRRLSLDELVDQFIKDHKRPPRIAIDAYLFIFQADHSSITIEDKESILVQNVMSKILALIGLNISVVVVFDGVLKPLKAKSKESLGLMYEEELVKLKSTSNYSEHHPMVDRVKQELKRNRINFVQAAGEGEAQCAYLQRLGVVDYCLSQDGDALVFGASKVLRNFSRYLEDIGRSPTKKTDATLKTTYYVTPVDIEVVEKETGLSLDRLVFLASLRGGDYSTGVKKIGITNAKNLALCGTSRALFHTRVKSKVELKELKNGLTQESATAPPDFASEFVQCFVKDRLPRLHPWELRLDPKTRRLKLAVFLSRMNYHLREHNRDVFGRKVTIDEDLKFDEYYTMVYLFPLINDKIPIFKPDTLGSGELEVDENLNIEGDVLRASSCDGKYYKQRVGEPICGLPEKQRSFFTPKNYNWSVKYILSKCMTHSSGLVQVTNFKEEDGIEKLMLKYDTFAVCKDYPESVEAKKTPGSSSPGKNYIWVPRSLVELYAPKLVEEFVEQKKEKEYFKKHKCSPQKTTLDTLGLSPSKKSAGPSVPVPFDLKTISPKKSVSTVSPSPKKRKKTELLPGQRKLDFFMKKESPFAKVPDLAQPPTQDDLPQEVHVEFKEDANPFIEPEEPHVLFREEEDGNPFIEAKTPGRSDAFFLTLPDIETDNIFIKRRPA